IENAGFEGVEILKETKFPVKYMINDPTAKAIIGETNISSEDIAEIGDAVASIRVSATKPDQ
ncbi:arsenite S-adenosylmethyltransferase, partial [Candidatus Bathyarchaeota archaeon]|nr:arsenite S-adenosylmethyltransferase [Candidatus Bathyarchaeota archaeon]